MRRRVFFICFCACLAILTPPATALVSTSQSEEFGPAKATATKPADPWRALAYLPGRVYALRNHWAGFGSIREDQLLAFTGDAARLNAAIAEFRRLPVPAKETHLPPETAPKITELDFLRLPVPVREIHLLPGPGTFRSLKGKVSGRCDWQIRWTSNTTVAHAGKPAATTHTAVLTVYVARAERIPALDARAAGWIKDLDHERFAERQRAFEQLAALGDAVAPLLQEEIDRAAAADGNSEPPSAERIARIETLLRRLVPIHPVQLRLPAGAAVLSVDDLLAREQKEWRSKNLPASWQAAEKIAALAEHSEQSLPLLIEMLHDDREQVRGLALKTLDGLDAKAAGLLPSLRVECDKARPASRKAFEQAIQLLIDLRPDDGDPASAADATDAWRHNRRLRDGIRRCISPHRKL